MIPCFACKRPVLNFALHSFRKWLKSYVFDGAKWILTKSHTKAFSFRPGFFLLENAMYCQFQSCCKQYKNFERFHCQFIVNSYIFPKTSYPLHYHCLVVNSMRTNDCWSVSDPCSSSIIDRFERYWRRHNFDAEIWREFSH